MPGEADKHHKHHRSVPGYGAFMGKIDVDRMDLVQCARPSSLLKLSFIRSVLGAGILDGWMSNGAMLTCSLAIAPRQNKARAIRTEDTRQDNYGLVVCKL